MPILKKLSTLVIPFDGQAAHAAGIKFGLVAWGNGGASKVEGASDYTFATPEELLALVR